jgi:hypothetical protein
MKLIQFKGKRKCPSCDNIVTELYDMKDKGKGVRCYLCRTSEELGPVPFIYVPAGHYIELDILEFLRRVRQK